MYTLIATIVLATVTGLDWNYIAHDSPARIVAVAGALCVILQLVKRLLPEVNGWVAIALNVILSACGILALTRPELIWTLATWQNVLDTSLAAAGIHGTVKLMAGPAAPQAIDAPAPRQARNATAMLLVFGVGLIALCSMTGCSDWERESFKTLSAAHAVIVEAETDYQTKKIPQTSAAYSSITKAAQIENTAVDGLEAYERLRQTKATGPELEKQQQAVSGILEQLPTLIADVRALYTPAPQPTR